MGQFQPGDRVSQSGIYRAYHYPHRLLHEVTFRANDIFPRCKQCGGQVRFELLRTMNGQGVASFRADEILEEYPERAKAYKQAG